MTQLDALYRYDVVPSERALLALDKMRDVYGVRRVEVRESDHIVRVEYDASRLTSAVIHQMLLGAGLDIVESLSGIAQQEATVSAALG